jgi:membrane protein implicated in regulation of membrane protease activity
LLGIGFATDASGRLAVLCSAVWLLMMSLGSLATGIIAQLLGGYALAGLLGLTFCAAAAFVAWPLARRLDAGCGLTSSAALSSTAG